MENKMQIFNNNAFGQLRTVEKDGEIWFVGKDVATALGYERDTKAVVDHVEQEDRFMVGGKTQSQFGIELGQRGGWLINESGLYSLILSSKLPKAKEFKHWVTAEVLPSIRKTGSYTQATPAQENRSKAMFMNAVTKQAKLWLAIGKASNLETYNQICQAKAAETLAGEPVLPLPRVAKMYSATQIGKMFGISANKVGRLAKLHNLKTGKYGELCGDIAPNGKQVSNFYYYETAIEKFRDILEGGEVA